ncbi:MAG: SRPBCC domain-containing protein [Actinomycetota bacterium]
MARIVFETTIESAPSAIADALTTEKGIASWWTDDVSFEGARGRTMLLGFPIAPVPFELKIEKANRKQVVWRSTGEFPPHWVDTTVTWTLTPENEGTTVHFNHDGWASDEGPLPMSAYTWGQLLGTLKRHVETGKPVPLFKKSGKSGGRKPGPGKPR